MAAPVLERSILYGMVALMARADTRAFFSFLAARSSEIIEPRSLSRRLAERSRLRVKLGIDPTAPDLHLGHLVPLRMLRTFQQAGHQAVLVIGDFTAEIGDPSGKSRTRRQLMPSEVRSNQRRYRAQVGRVLDLKRTEIRHNSEWYERMSLRELLEILRRVSLKSVWERQDFRRRMSAGKAVYLHEAMYSVLQAYDSVAVRADVELGSLDQKLNLLAGRELQRSLGQSPQEVVLLPYLIGLDGTGKMSKTVGNTINLQDSAPEMFGRVMSIPDRLIVNYAELAAWMSVDAVGAIRRRLVRQENPRDVKLDVALAVVVLYHGAAQASQAREAFLRTYSRRELPERAAPSGLRPGSYRPLELISRLGAVASHSAARRLLRGGALKVDGRAVDADALRVSIAPGSIIRVGKKRFFQVR